ncbi:MAG TPA: fasciclin domain-containing protein [Methanoregulaceae archaeon]|nr:fasciclin domain-containing protein [Methanoregulaceae archaeon]
MTEKKGYSWYRIVITGLCAVLLLTAATSATGITVKPFKTTPLLGNIQVNSVPSGSTAILDGAKKATTPALFTNVLAGSHAVQVKQTGYKDFSAGVQVSGGKTSVVTATLTSKPDIYDTLLTDGRFTTLVKALQLTKLDTTLQSGGPYTIFAPTDAAFRKLPAATLNALMSNPTQLKKVLQYNIVPGYAAVADIKCSNGIIHITDTVQMPPKI